MVRVTSTGCYVTPPGALDQRGESNAPVLLGPIVGGANDLDPAGGGVLFNYLVS